MEKYLYGVIGVIVGFIICYFIHKDWDGGDSVFKCPDDEIMVQYCVKKSDVDYPNDTNIDDTMKGYYQNAANNGNNVGFSLDRQLILNLAAYLFPSTSSAGIRVYPGEDNTNKYVLIKPINADGVEIANFGRIIDVTNLYYGLGGPCPDWCNNTGRIITQ